MSARGREAAAPPRGNHQRAGLQNSGFCPLCGVLRKTKRVWRQELGCYERRAVKCGHVWLDYGGTGIEPQVPRR